MAVVSTGLPVRIGQRETIVEVSVYVAQSRISRLRQRAWRGRRLARKDLPIMKGRFFIGMGREQRANHGFDALVVTNHFDADFGHDLESSDTTQKGLATLGGTKLAFPQNLPGTAFVVPDSACAGTEDGILHRVAMGFGDVETQLIHHELPLR
jgi:hypothetical protein